MSDQSAALIGFLVLGIMAIVSVGSYLFGCWVLHRIGHKFGIGSFGLYCIPIYNLVLLCRCAQISPWYLLGFIIPLGNCGTAIWLWGNVARQMGRSFWAYGLGSFFAIPVLVLAFGDAQPIQTAPPAIAPEPSPSPIPVHAAEFALQSTSGEVAGAVISIPAGVNQSLVIGRNPQLAQIVLTHEHVSSRHARVWTEPITGGSTVLCLEDLNSTNGTHYRLGGQPTWTSLRGGTVRLREQSMIRIADVADFVIVRAGLPA